jgi:hypothetical protein
VRRPTHRPARADAFALVALTTTLLALALPSFAAAGFGPIELVSKSPLEQASHASEPAISADGHYVAFCGALGGREGIFSEQVGTDRPVPVAVEGEGLGCGEGGYANAPSISAEGRYVSFVTSASLVPADTEPKSRDVYVADLTTSPPTYRLVSAVDGGEESLPGEANAADHTAMSADGDRVAFVDEGNVYVREISTERTILITAQREANGTMTDQPVIGGGAYEPPGASISADGSTVAWVGEHLPEQVPLLVDEEAEIRKIETGGDMSPQGTEYHEPLWRRVPTVLEERPPTRRVVGGGDPLAPGCPPNGTLEEPACQGPYPEAIEDNFEESADVSGWGWGLGLPQLDANGDEVAVVGRPGKQYDLFAVNMAPGLDRRQAVDQLTRWTDPVPQNVSNPVILREERYWPFTGAVDECAISPDGTRVAFATTRQHFETSPLTLVSGLPSAVSLLPELYEANLEAGTIERVTPGGEEDISVAKAESNAGGTKSPAYAGDRWIAFSSEANNLVADDGNEGSDVFVVEAPTPTPRGATTISPPPGHPVTQPAWDMTVNAFSRPDGRVRLVAQVPGEGTLKAVAHSQLGTRLKTRQIASGRRQATGAQVVTMNLALGRKRRPLAHLPGGLVTRLQVNFTGPGGRPLRADLQTRFQVHAKRRKPGTRRRAPR